MMYDTIVKQHGGRIDFNTELWRCLTPYADAAGIAALTRAWQAGEGKDRLAIALQHVAAGASTDLPFRDEVVQFKTRLADEKIGWRDLA
jgi:hypothetical protein